MTKKFRKYLSLSLTVIMASTLTVGQALAFADELNKDEGVVTTVQANGISFSDVTGRADVSGVAIENFGSQVIQNYVKEVAEAEQTVIVKLEQDSLLTASNNSSIATYLSTSAGRKALYKIEKSQSDFLTKLKISGIDYKVVNTYSTIMNGLTIKVDTTKLSQIKAISGVESVVVSDYYAYPEEVSAETTSGSSTTQADGSAVSNPNNVYTTGIYDSSKYVADGIDGSGMTVAILDTGLDYAHSAFQTMPSALGLTKSQLTNFLASKDFTSESLSAARGNIIDADDLYVNDKVPFAYDYADSDADVYPSYSNHGTHVAGIVGGSDTSYTNSDGEIATDAEGNNIPFIGVAPNSQLVICKVFTDDFDSSDLGGATTETLLAALEDCVNLGVDVINMSLGTVAGFSSIYIEGDSEGEMLNKVYTSIRDTGISLVCAASNEYSSGYGSVFGTNLASNPDSGTVGSPSTFVGALSVASINGQTSPYMIANESDAIFFENASDENSVQYDFIEQMIGTQTSGTFKYVVIPGTGRAADYTSTIRAQIADKTDGKVIAVVRRGTSTFQDKVDIAQRMGADAIIIYNNVSGMVRMSVGDLLEPIPAVSVNLDAGRSLIFNENGTSRTSGTLEINTSYQAGPFMNDYSSWGVTSDLKLKPEITAHGGEITSTVPGGYDEMSGTSMASPNLAGFIALLRSQLKKDYSSLSNVEISKMVNQLVMSTAEIVYDQNGLPYSPRKQGAGLAVLDNVFNSKAYLFTDEENGGAAEDRPKAELGSDDEKKGEYTINFSVKNTSDTELSFKAETIFMTETISSDGLSVAEQAHLLTDVPSVWSINGRTYADGATFAVAANSTVSIKVDLKLSDAEKSYIDTNFVNGMFIEGFLRLLSATDGQCDLTLPFMGFYGDWKSAPLLDYDAYEIAAFEQDTSYTDETRPHASVWATQAYSQYYNSQYYVPIGSFMYLQDENADQVYANQEHNVLSTYDIYNGEGAADNYMTNTGIYALYAGLLRNAALVTYDMYDKTTGETIVTGKDYRIGKAYSSSGGSPAGVITELLTSDLGLLNNGKYEIKFNFYFDADDEENGVEVPEENTFTMSFYVDYEAPVLEGASIRYYDYLDGNTPKQNVYLDVQIYDNTYAQSVMFCYGVTDTHTGLLNLNVATDYVTPVYNGNFNGTTTVSIDVTDIVEYKDGVAFFPESTMYLRLDDYGLNASVWQVNFGQANTENTPDTFTIANETSVNLDIYGTHTVQLNYTGDYNLSNFNWGTTRSDIAAVKNGEIVGLSAGTATISVSNGSVSRTIRVVVSDKKRDLATPTISFGNMKNYGDSVVAASGTVEVNAATNFTLDIVTNPWYYPVKDLTIRWTSSNEDVATVDSNGNVQTLEPERGGTAIIQAVIMNGNIATLYSTSVVLNVRDPFTISNYTLTDYHGFSEDVVIPSDRNILYIGEEAFMYDETVKTITIPKTVMQINRRAFLGCTSLEEVYFIQKEALPVADASLNLILREAFAECTSLKKVDLTNCKTITVDSLAFSGCSALAEVVKMQSIGSMYSRAFSGCTSLTSVDLTKLHKAESNVFEGCTSLETVTTDYYTSFGNGMFTGCTSLREIVLNMPIVPSNAFRDCTNLEKVDFGSQTTNINYFINSEAFSGCTSLAQVNFYNNTITRIGDQAFVDCTSLSNITLPQGTNLGASVFSANTTISYVGGSYETDNFGAIYLNNTLVLAPKVIPAGFAIREETTAIAQYAFSGTTLASDANDTLTIPDSVISLGEGVFALSAFKTVNLGRGITQIPAHTFDSVKITTFTVNSTITSIGDYAFAGCTDLTSLVFEGTSSLASIGNYGFAQSSLSNLTLPASVKSIGDYCFAESKLNSVDLGSVETMGDYAFVSCEELVTVTTGGALEEVSAFAFALCPNLKNVTLGDRVDVLASYSFAACEALETINLKNVRVVGESAFYNDASLVTVENLSSLISIGDRAFALTSINGTLDLANVTYIGSFAFYSEAETAYSSITIPKVVVIGNYAFFGNDATTLALPATLEYLGDGAFANSNIATVTVNASNENYFSENNVVYRNITTSTGELSGYELAYYPSNRTQTLNNGTRQYVVKEGTISVQAYAFAYLNSGILSSVSLPYSVKTLGEAAFYTSGITSYIFNSINAPALLTGVVDTGIDGLRTLYYTTFEDNILLHTSGLIEPTETPATLSISYPTNGVGYDNYIFNTYFSTKTQLGEFMTDDTRAIKNAIEGFRTASEVAAWNSLEVNEENTKMVTEFSDAVKAAHEIYNTIRNNKVQLEFLGSENIEKLFAIEDALSSVKTRFNIEASVTSLSISESSTHKTEYVEGEFFDMSGLIITVNYDDYSSREADMSQITLVTDSALTTLNRYVIISGYGRRVQVSITVTEEGGNGGNENPSGGNDETGMSPTTMTIIICSSVGGVVVLAGAAVAIILIKKRKNNESKK